MNHPDDEIPSILEYMNKFLLWLVQSSADPNKLALTVKGILTALIPLALMVLNVAHVSLLPTQIDSLVIDITALISLILTAVGLIRKIYLTFK